MTTIDQKICRYLVGKAVGYGWIRLPSHSQAVTARREYTAAQRRNQQLYMARLRAERKGLDTSKFPVRIRKRFTRQNGI